MKSEHPRPWVFGLESLSRDLGPYAAGGAGLCHLLQEIALCAAKEGESRAEVVNIQAGVQGRLNIGNGVGEGEGQLLYRRGTSLAHVIAADTYGVPLWRVLGTVREGIGYEAHGRQRWGD